VGGAAARLGVIAVGGEQREHRPRRVDDARAAAAEALHAVARVGLVRVRVRVRGRG